MAHILSNVALNGSCRRLSTPIFSNRNPHDSSRLLTSAWHAGVAPFAARVRSASAQRYSPMMRYTLLLVALLTAACGSDPPMAPSIPAALLSYQGQLRFENCSASGCLFTGEAHNVGTGCAGNVRGITRLFTATNAVEDVASWSSRLTIRPGETFLYSGFIRPAAGSGGYYTTEFSWDNVRCS